MKILAQKRIVAYDEYKSDVDKAIQNYVSSEWFSVNLDSVLDEAISMYSNTRPCTIYRGLNFLTKQDYDNFVRSIKNGRLTINTLSSWTTKKSVAESFARSRKMNLGVFYDKNDPYWAARASQAHDRMIGYRGVVLYTKIPAGIGLDMDRAGYSSEAEIVLPAGTYTVKYYDYLTYADKYKGQSVDDILFKLLNRAKEFDHILLYFKDKGLRPSDLSDYIRHQIFLKEIKLNEINPFTKITNSSVFLDSALPVDYTSIYCTVTKCPNVDVLDWYTQTDLLKLSIQFKSSLSKMIVEARHLSDEYPEYPIRIRDEVLALARRLDPDKYAECIKLLRRHYKPRYDAVSDRAYSINKIKDSKARKDAIEKYKNDIELILKQLTSD